MSRKARKSLPASIEAAWGIRERPGRGPKPALSVGRIVEAGVKVAAAQGLAAVSMSRVAGQLGAATMALYRHVSAKEELLALMMDWAFRTPPDPPRAGEAWRAALSRWAREHRAILHRHPWVVRIPLGGPPIMPNQVVWLERALSSLEGTGLTEAEKLSAVLLVNGFIRNEAALATDLRSAARAKRSPLASAMSSYGEVLSRLVDAERFPAISRAIASGVFDQPGAGDTGTDFEFGLERILDGVAILVRKRTPRRK